MFLKYWAGYITRKTILQNGHMEHWLRSWVKRADQAEARGNELVVFEVPKDDLLHAVSDIEALLQHRYGGHTPVNEEKLFVEHGFLQVIRQQPNGSKEQ